MRNFPARLQLAILVQAFTLGACAGPPEPPGLRVIAQAVAEWPTSAAFAERASILAGVPVRDVQAEGARRYTLTLVCRDEAACQQALRRLREPSFTAAVDVDARRGIPARPAASQSL